VTQNLAPGRPPGWRTRRLVQWSALEDKGRKFLMEDRSKSPVTPVRFVQACRRGHIGDIDWQAFVHSQNPPCGRELYLDERGTSGDLGETYVRCGCGLERPMSQAADPNSRALGDCDGGRPWLCFSTELQEIPSPRFSTAGTHSGCREISARMSGATRGTDFSFGLRRMHGYRSRRE
jgi:hypothetical protein